MYTKPLLLLGIPLLFAAGPAPQERAGEVRVTEVERSADRPVFAVEIGSGAARRRGTFSNATQRIKSVNTTAARQRVAIVGETSAAEMVTIVDTTTVKAIDSFYSLNTALSPNGRWVVFQYFRGGGAPAAGAVYGFYDLDRPPAENRVDGPPSEWGAGIPIYPEPYRTAKRWTSVTEGEDHVSMSPLMWIRSDQVAWVDRSDQDVRLIVATLAQPGRTVIVKTGQLDPATVVGGTVSADAQPSRLLLAESIVPSSEPDAFTVTFKPLPELRKTSVQVRVW